MKRLFSLLVALVTIAGTMIFGAAPISAQDGPELTVPHIQGAGPIIDKGTSVDDTQIELGNTNPDVILQFGLGGNDTQYISGDDGDD